MQTINKPIAYEQMKKGPWEEVICHNKTIKIVVENTHFIFEDAKKEWLLRGWWDGAISEAIATVMSTWVWIVVLVEVGYRAMYIGNPRAGK